MLAGRVGGAFAAELGTMRVTEQIDSMSSMGANPIHYLVVPRFLACLILIPSLTVMADFMGVAGGYFYSVHVLDIDMHHYFINSKHYVGSFDLFLGIFKSLFFGAAIALDQLPPRFPLRSWCRRCRAGGNHGVCLFFCNHSNFRFIPQYRLRLNLFHDLARRSETGLIRKDNP